MKVATIKFEGGNVPTKLLRQINRLLDEEGFEVRVELDLAHQQEEPPSGRLLGSSYSFTSFVGPVRTILTHAREEAVSLAHNYIGTEHILLALVAAPDQDQIAGEILGDMGIDFSTFRAYVKFIIGRGDPNKEVDKEMGLTPRAKKVVELAVDEARREGTEINSGHLLLGLLREGEGIAAGALEAYGVTLTNVRESLRRCSH